MISLRRATIDDLALVLPRTRALNDHEGIAIENDLLARALRTLLTEPALGGVWLILRDAAPCGYAIVTFGFDLEFGGREAWLTELYVDAPGRTAGAGSATLDLLADELRTLGIRAMHLQVRPENAAKRLYERHEFVASPRILMTRRLV